MKDVFTLYDEAGKLVIKKAMVQHIKVFLDEQGKGKAEKYIVHSEMTGLELEVTDDTTIEALLWSSFFVTFLANKIKLLSVSILAVSATLDNGAEGYYQIVADSDDLKNRFFFLVSVGEKVSYPSAPLSRACPFGVAAFYLQL